MAGGGALSGGAAGPPCLTTRKIKWLALDS